MFTTWSSFVNNKKKDDSTSPIIQFANDWTTKAQQHITASNVISFVIGGGSALAFLAVHRKFFKRLPTADSIHPSMITRQRWIKGVVTSVGDGDGFRLYHTPGPFWRWPLKLRRVPVGAKDLKDETIHIRLAGVDAPEAAHFGKVAQPYSAEALSWLKREVEGRRVWVQLIRRDQYGRIVSVPLHPPRIPFLNPPSRCISIRMLSEGLATTYEQSGAEYGRWGKDVFLKYEETAKANKRGMWGSKTILESPAEYKKRYREGGVVEPSVREAAKTPVCTGTTTSSTKRTATATSKSGWRRFVPFL